MKDAQKTKKELIKELTRLRQQIHEYESLHEGRNHTTELILDAVGEGIFGLDIQGKHTFVNPSAARMLGYTVDELTGRHSHTLWHHKKPDGTAYPEDECPIYAAYREGKACHGQDAVFWRKDGTSFPAQFTSTPIVKDGEIIGAVVTFIDITKRMHIEESLKLNEERFASLLKLSQMEGMSEKEITEYALEEAVRLTRSAGGYLHFFNEDEQTIQLYSWSKDVLETCTASQDQHYPLNNAGVWADSVRLKEEVIHNDYQSLANKKGYPEGHFHLVRHLGIPILEGDRIVGVTGVGNKETPYEESDGRQLTLFMHSMWGILKHKRLEQEREKLVADLQELSVRDELTGLYNRRGLMNMVTQYCSIAKRIKKNAMLIFIDLDGMKKINDNYGHDEGDRALIDTANILKSAFRETDIIGRIGGDEFAVFGMVMESKAIDIVTERIHEKLEKHIREYTGRSEKPYASSFSYGIAFADPQKTNSCDSLMSEADKNMYLQKRRKSLNKSKK